MGEPIKPKGDAPASITLSQAELDAILARAATEAAAAAIAQMSKAQPGSTPSNDAQALVQALAMEIANISYQGGDKRNAPVDPKVLAERAAAEDRMHALILEAKALPKGDPEAPKYRTRSKQQLNDVMIDPWRRDAASKKAIPVEFFWRLEPNDAMIPLNDRAKAIFAEFRGSRGNKADYLREQQRMAWLTDGGLIVEGAAPARRAIEQTDYERDGDLTVDLGDGPDDPNAQFKRVLGTSHAPARIGAYGNA